VTTATAALPIDETLAPSDVAGAAEIVREAAAARRAIYPIGGGTSLRCGLVSTKPGIGLSTTGLTRVIDYPARDMTITVEAGMTIARLAEILAAENQQLPIDVPQAGEATIGGVIATGMSGPRRYGYGTIRDYVIGIEAIDGRGTVFHAGGRVVKNVAGYDFCKLLTGSYGTLGLITHVTLKVRPRPETMAVAFCGAFHPKMAEGLFEKLITHSVLTPVGLEFCTQRDSTDASDCPFVAVMLEGSQAEVAWQLEQWELAKHGSGIGGGRTLVGTDATEQWSRFVEFAAAGSAPLMLKFGVPSSQVIKMAQLVLDIDPTSLIQAHAGNGIVLAHLPGLAPTAAAKALISQLRPAAVAVGGHVVVWDTATPHEFTSQAMWGSLGSSLPWMRAVKQQFDPHGIFNPGRFVYGD